LFSSAWADPVTSYSQIFVFGDSLSDTGNATIASGGLYPGANYAPGRFTDGPNTTPATTGPVGLWVEQLAAKLGVADPQPFLNGGTNYAVASAMTGSNNLDGITDQINYFLGQHSPASSTALYAIWGGANDFFFGNNTPNTAASVADNLYKNIQTLAGDGAKNFLWVNLPPLDATPRGRSSGGSLGTEVTNFNMEWTADIAALRSQGINVVGVDVYSLFVQVAGNPGAYGFMNVKDPAQGKSGVDPNTYLFWDQEHPTTAGHASVANLAYDDLTASSVPEPMSLAVTALGLSLLLAAERVRRSRRNADLRSRS
jgi:phospholipase/lecithinase/hemolysin